MAPARQCVGCAPQLTFRAQTPYEFCHLTAQEREGPIVGQNKSGKFNFSSQWHLLGNSLLGQRAIDATLFQPRNLRGERTGHTGHKIKSFFQAPLEKQRDLNHAVFAGQLLGASPPTPIDFRMYSAFQPLKVFAIGEYTPPQSSAVHGAVSEQHPSSKTLGDICNDTWVSKHFLPYDLIDIDALKAHLREELPCSRFAASHAACEAE